MKETNTAQSQQHREKHKQILLKVNSIEKSIGYAMVVSLHELKQTIQAQD